MLNVILRTCDTVEIENHWSNRPRDFGSKQDVIRTCTGSLRKSLDYYASRTGSPANFVIIDDHSSDETLAFLRALGPAELIRLPEAGNGVSFAACLEKARTLEGLLLFIEDDYFLQESCLYEMVSLYEQFAVNHQTICVYPSDYPDRYHNPEPCFIVLGERRHWRTVLHTTCTFMIDKATLLKYYAPLSRFKNFRNDPAISEENTVNLIYKEVLCFSPIPSLAEHFQYHETLSPFFAPETIRRA